VEIRLLEQRPAQLHEYLAFSPRQPDHPFQPTLIHDRVSPWRSTN
jgi:hypothetical protein